MLNIINCKRNANENHKKYHFTPVRMAMIKKYTNNKCWQGCGEKGAPVHCQEEYKLLQPLWKTVWRFLKKLKLKLPYDLAIPLLGMYSKNAPLTTKIYALFKINKILKQPKYQSKEDMVYIQ